MFFKSIHLINRVRRLVEEFCDEMVQPTNKLTNELTQRLEHTLVTLNSNNFNFYSLSTHPSSFHLPLI